MIKKKNYVLNQSLFITGTNTDVGKTYASSVLLKRLSQEGFKVGYFKPIETGVIDHPVDGLAMLELTKKLNPNFNVNIDFIVPYQFKLPAAPYVAKKDTNIDIEFLIKRKNELEELCDILIIEGAGGLMVPIMKDFFIIDLIKKFKSKTILISPSRLGSINDTLLSQEALKNRNIDFDWYINLFEDKDSFDEVTLPFYKDYFDEINFLNDIA
ncbi:dethiobiotin synthase [uncultured Arcobacter sp.]|uniref:dethiobiotin synthase n=1 Tax=uncultured Arcobacter sp. TaxID=165434 RepID=UPI0026213E6F|nr:dethiobiotin synthase [uncultured Arcobacter sp.]